MLIVFLLSKMLIKTGVYMFEKLANLSVGLGVASIIGSLSTWAMGRSKKEDDKLHDEHLGLLVGLWPPTFFLLALYLFKLQEKGYENEAEELRKKVKDMAPA
ncbi:MAG: hypothetical protein WD491_06675 [Balneolales bacterium]